MNKKLSIGPGFIRGLKEAQKMGFSPNTLSSDIKKPTLKNEKPRNLNSGAAIVFYPENSLSADFQDILSQIGFQNFTS